MNPLPIAISMGEPAGIGTEILLKLHTSVSQETRPAFYLIDDINRVKQKAVELGYPHINVIQIDSPQNLTKIGVNAFPVFHIPVPHHPTLHYPQPNPHNTKAVIQSIEVAVEHIKKGLAAAITTLPIDKHILHKGGFTYPGHTEFLGSFSHNNQTPLMVLSSPELRTFPLTGHMALKEVFKNLTHDMITSKIKTLHDHMQTHFNLKEPRIVVAGLNPHAGENGDMGDEEINIIAPAIHTLKQQGMNITGPHAADTMFTKEKREKYDIAVCFYHDQALIPVKTLAFDHCANITLNIPFVRTSPDHGVAMDIAGKGIARYDSLLYALQEAQRLSQNIYHIQGSYFNHDF